MPKKTKSDLIRCPDNCPGGTPNKQFRLTEDQRDRFTGPAVKLVHDDFKKLYRCGGCGCVYLPRQISARKLGHV